MGLWDLVATWRAPRPLPGARVVVVGRGLGIVTDYHDGLEASTVTVRHDDDGLEDEHLTDSHEGDGIERVIVLRAAP